MKNVSEMKIGVFVITGLFLLVLGWAFLREFAIQTQASFSVVFDDVAGLARGSFVRINGLRVGRVDSLTLDIKRNKVLVLTRLQLPDVHVPKDSKFFIRTSGYVGDKYLDIALGMSMDYVHDGDEVIGEATYDSFKSLERVSEVINEIDPTILGKNIQEITTGTVGFLKKADNLADDVDKVVQGIPKGKDFEKVVSQAYGTVDKLNDAIDKVEKLATNDQAGNNINKLLSHANNVSSDLKDALQNASDLANNEQAFGEVNNLLVRASKVIEQLDEIRADPLIQNELRDTLTNAKDAAKSVEMTSDELSAALHQRFLLPKLWFGKLLPKKKDVDIKD